MGFGFWDETAGFDINQSLISYSALSTYGRAFFVGLWNTLLVAGIGVVLATFLGFFVGIARLSQNLVVSKLATLSPPSAAVSLASTFTTTGVSTGVEAESSAAATGWSVVPLGLAAFALANVLYMSL